MNKSRSIKSVASSAGRILFQPLLAILLGLVVGAVVIVIAGENPLYVYGQMFEKSFFNMYYLMQTLSRSVPISVCALAIIVAWRAGYINLGVEGQMITGAFVGTIISIYVPGPTWLVFILAIVCGMVAGALVASLSAFIYDKFNVSIVISTLMMNYIAAYITSYFITFPLRDPTNAIAIQTAEVPEAMRLPRLVEGNTFNLGFIIVVAMVILFLFITHKTNFGYESKMTGLNPVFARYGGVKSRKVMYSTMALSGALAAVAGMLEVFGVKYRFIDAMFTSTSYAWTGLMSGLISSLHPIGSFIVSIFLSGLQVGGQAIQRTTSIPLQVATLIQSTITLFVSVRLFVQFRRARKETKDKDAPKGGKQKSKVGEA
jgi:simple sugar transport system permease protein